MGGEFSHRRNSSNRGSRRPGFRCERLLRTPQHPDRNSGDDETGGTEGQCGHAFPLENPGRGQAENRDDAITFYADGTADVCEILLQDRDGFRLALRINPATARVRVVELERR